VGTANRKIVSITRILHVICSMLAAGMLCLFAVSGIAMVHEESFGLDSPESKTTEAAIPADLAKSAEREEVVAHLRGTLGLAGEAEAFEVEDESIRVLLSRPGRRVEVSISRADGKAEVLVERGGLLAVLADLHRGKHAGEFWRRLIDAAGACLLLAWLTGIVLWLATPSRRLLGLAAAVVGLALAVGAWLLMP